MSVTTMSVARALVELKVLDKRIEDLTVRFMSVGYKVGGKLHRGNQSIEEFSQKIKSDQQKIVALLRRRHNVKAGIVESNAKTYVTVGKDEPKLVAVVIEYKKSIEMEKALNSRIRTNYHQAIQEVEKHNLAAQVRMDASAASVLAKGTSKDAEEYKAFCATFLANNLAEVVDPLNTPAITEPETDRILDFEMNVDVTLSESNARTMIEVPD